MLKQSEPPSYTLIIGDSNIVRMQGDFNEKQPGYSNGLAKYKIDVEARPGFRALFLGWEQAKVALSYTHVIVFCGNNDISKHPKDKFQIRSPEATAEDLIIFHDFLWKAGTKCFIVGMMKRKDLRDENGIERIRATNKILKARLKSQKTYVGPRTIQSKHFKDWDEAHLTEEGKFLVRALVLRIIEKRYTEVN